MRRRQHNRHLPPCVYLRAGTYYLVKRGKWHNLGRSLPVALAEYGRRLAPANSGALNKLFDDALDSHRAAVNTMRQYRGAAEKLKAMLAEFSDPAEVKPRHIAEIRRHLADTPNMANRCLTVLRVVFDYALEEQLIDSNPAVGIRRLEEKKRERLIAAEEFAQIRAKATPRLQLIMDLLYLTGQRVQDVLRISRNDLQDDGIAFRQQKTGSRLIVRWTPELRAAVALAKTLSPVPAVTLFRNRRGKAPDYTTIHREWMEACIAAGVADADLRDLRAMSGTATKRQGQNPTALLGHTSPTMTARYLRDREVPVVDGPSFGTQIERAKNGK
jgi:integrase